MWRKSKTKDHSELMEQYQQIREIAQQLYNEVLPQYLPKEAFQTCGKKLGIMHKSTLVFSDMDCMAVLMDYCLYEYRVKGKNAIARYLAEAQLDPNSLEGMVTQAMSDSFYALLQVEEALRGIGIKVHDFVRDRRFLMVDINLGRTAVPGVVIATRVLPHEDFATTSGAPLSVNAEVLSQLRSLLTQRRVDEEEGKNDEQAWADLATSVIRTCLAGHADSKMEHRETNIESISAPLRKDARVGRNDPCPCGSGRKHKRCCGALASL